MLLPFRRVDNTLGRPDLHHDMWIAVLQLLDLTFDRNRLIQQEVRVAMVFARELPARTKITITAGSICLICRLPGLKG